MAALSKACRCPSLTLKATHRYSTHANSFLGLKRKHTELVEGARKSRKMSLLTCDVCDAHEDQLASGELQVLTPGVFQSFGQKRIYSGRVVTVKCFEDNVLLRKTLEEPGHGKVLVVDGDGSLRNALVGGNVAKLAETSGWAGLVIFGCVRDVDEINECAIGVRALAPCPVKSKKIGAGEKNVVVSFSGATIRPGDFCWVDNDGILVSTSVAPSNL